METVAPDPLLGIFPRQGKGLGHGRDARVKGGVEAGHLGHAGVSLGNDADGGQVVRLMQRRQGNEFFQVLQDVIVDDGGFRVLEAAVNDTVPHGHNPVGAVEHSAAPGKEGIDGPFVVEGRARRPLFLLDDLPGAVFHLEAGLRADALDLAVVKRRRVSLCIGVDRELEARRSRIENDDEISHGAHLVSYLPLRRAWATCTMTATEASLVRIESARLVRTMGIRVPSTMPAPSAPAR